MGQLSRHQNMVFVEDTIAEPSSSFRIVLWVIGVQMHGMELLLCLIQLLMGSLDLSFGGSIPFNSR